MEDLADLRFSMRQVADEAVSSQPAVDRALARSVTERWAQRNFAALLAGYLENPAVAELVGADLEEVSARVAELVDERAARLDPRAPTG